MDRSELTRRDRERLEAALAKDKGALNEEDKAVLVGRADYLTEEEKEKLLGEEPVEVKPKRKKVTE